MVNYGSIVDIIAETGILSIIPENRIKDSHVCVGTIAHYTARTTFRAVL